MRLERNRPTNQLIFDIGSFSGDNSSYFLVKGFEVVSIDANPNAVRIQKQKFGKKFDQMLTLLHGAIGPQHSQVIDFYINEREESFSSIVLENASRSGIDKTTKIQVPVIDLETLLVQKGTPYYIKADISGGEKYLIQQLSKIESLPRYLSVGLHDIETIHEIRKLGYLSFQIRNQLLNSLLQSPFPSQEGRSIRNFSFTTFHSGPFGKDLPSNGWMPIAGTIEYFKSYLKVCNTEPLSGSWFDLHAKYG